MRTEIAISSVIVVLTIATAAVAAPPAQKCTAGKLRVAGNYDLCRLKALAKATRIGMPVDYSTCDAKFSDKWARVETSAGGSCPTVGDGGAIQSFLAQHTDDVADALAGAGLPSCPGELETCATDLASCVSQLGSCQGLTQTGQSVSLPADKNDGVPGVVAVPDDGALQRGHPMTFIDNGDGTITDLQTGLMWEKKDRAGGLHDALERYYWSGGEGAETIWDWLDDLNSEGVSGFAGHSDWRIPNVRELLSLAVWARAPGSAFIHPIFHSACTPGCNVSACSCTPISGVSPTSYWSSTSSGPGTVWFVDYSFLEIYTTTQLQELSYVRAVRGGQ